MKLVLVQAFVKKHKLAGVTAALHHVDGVTGVSASDVRGWGQGKLRAEQEHPEERINDFEPHVRVEVFCAAAIVEPVIAAIREAAHTGLTGDGKIYVLSVEAEVSIRTGERGGTA